MFSSNKSELDFLKVAPTRHKGSSRSIHPYFGKVDPALALAIIHEYSTAGDVILDPFCGSGTVLHESFLQRRHVVGWDSSPLATMISSAKLLGISPEEKQWIENKISYLVNFSSKAGLLRLDVPTNFPVPAMPRVQNVESWFESQALIELSFLRDYINKESKNASQALTLMLNISFSRIIISASNQQGESTYRRVIKESYSGRVIDLYLKALKSTISYLLSFSSEVARLLIDPDRHYVSLNNDHIIERKDLSTYIINHDSRSGRPGLHNELAHLVVTSPPYLMSWDYGLYHKLRFYWLGYDLDNYEATEIGRHLRRKNDDVSQYTEDMNALFRSLDKSVRPDGVIVMINAPSVVRGELVDTNQILANCGANAGWIINHSLATIDIPGPHHGMYSSLESRGAETAGASGKKEHVLIFKRR